MRSKWVCTRQRAAARHLNIAARALAWLGLAWILLDGLCSPPPQASTSCAARAGIQTRSEAASIDPRFGPATRLGTPWRRPLVAYFACLVSVWDDAPNGRLAWRRWAWASSITPTHPRPHRSTPTRRARGQAIVCRSRAGGWGGATCRQAKGASQSRGDGEPDQTRPVRPTGPARLLPLQTAASSAQWVQRPPGSRASRSPEKVSERRAPRTPEVEVVFSLGAFDGRSINRCMRGGRAHSLIDWSPRPKPTQTLGHDLSATTRNRRSK